MNFYRRYTPLLLIALVSVLTILKFSSTINYPKLLRITKWNLKHPFRAPILVVEPKYQTSEISKAKICEPRGLKGRLKIERNVPSLRAMVPQHTELSLGGYYKPRNCTSLQRVAVVIPYRGREEHLRILISHIHPLLQRQQIHYQIVVVEQLGEEPFNRAMLFNAGFLEAIKIKRFDCFIFHDVDHIPEDDRNLYDCPEMPMHMSVAEDIHFYRLLYPQFLGGVVSLRTEHFRLVNGFSNVYWGDGGGAENDDLYERIIYNDLDIHRRKEDIARYTVLTYNNDNKAQRRSTHQQQALLSSSGFERSGWDGLSNVKYSVEEIAPHRLFLHIRVHLYHVLMQGY